MADRESVFKARIYFTGHAQGVGFRYQTRRIATGFDVTGFVRNLPDGRVEVLAEGAASEIDAFVAELERQMATYVRKTEKKTGEGERNYGDFVIER